MADKLTRQLFALLRKAGPITRDQRLKLYRWFLARNNIETTNDLATYEIEAIVSQLRTWDSNGLLVGMVAEVIAA